MTNMTHDHHLDLSQQSLILVVMLDGNAGDETAKNERLGSVASQKGEENQAEKCAPPGRRRHALCLLSLNAG